MFLGLGKEKKRKEKIKKGGKEWNKTKEKIKVRMVGKERIRRKIKKYEQRDTNKINYLYFTVSQPFGGYLNQGAFFYYFARIF